MTKFSIGVDVGTGSVRAGVVDVRNGALLSSCVKKIELHEVPGEEDYYEQSSEEIWKATCECVGESLKKLETDSSLEFKRTDVVGIGFDATCSLVVLDKDGCAVTVSPTGKDDRNIIVWMDHRAEAEAAMINKSGHEVLSYVGGKISPEMETPKLVWLKKNLPESWARAEYFLDLADFLTFRATGSDIRSLCTNHILAGKDRIEAGSEGWNDKYWKSIGLSDIVEEGYRRVGTSVKPVGHNLGGLTAAASAELGLPRETNVVTSIIDAHAGGIGVLGSRIDDEILSPSSLEHRIAIISGTSTCHMGVSREPNYIKGIWGPYYSAMVPGMWLTEGGQSASGALIDFVIQRHPAYSSALVEADNQGVTIYDYLNQRIEELRREKNLASASMLNADFHMLPYFHGNRSPRADSSLKGVVSGYTLASNEKSLLTEYLAVVLALGFGTRHILSEMNANGYAIDTIFVTGGLSNNELFLRTHADITQCRLFVPAEANSVLIGAAVLGAVAGGAHESVLAAMAEMNKAGVRMDPTGNAEEIDFLERKYRVFQKMYDDFMYYRDIMSLK